MDCIAQSEGSIHELKAKLEFSKLCNKVADFWYSLLFDKYHTLKKELASNRIYSEETVQQSAKVSRMPLWALMT